MQYTFDKVRVIGEITIKPENMEVKPSTSTSDLFQYGMKYLLDNNYLSKDEIGAIIAVTSSPDYYVPFLSYMVHGEFELTDDVLCIDLMESGIKQVKGFLQACMLTEKIPDKKMLLFTGDVWSKARTNPQNHVADGAKIFVMQYAETANPILIETGIDSQMIEWGQELSGAFADLWHKKEAATQQDQELLKRVAERVREQQEEFTQRNQGYKGKRIHEFGCGLQWGNMIIPMDDLAFNEIITSNL